MESEKSPLSGLTLSQPEKKKDDDHGLIGLSVKDGKAEVTTRVHMDSVGPDTPTLTHPNGAKESDIPYRFDLIDGLAMAEMAKVLKDGAEKYGIDNWRGIDLSSHLNHLLMHTFAYLAGDDSDNHLAHILCRATFAVAVAGAGISSKEPF